MTDHLLCPKDDGVLVPDHEDRVFRCPNCGNSYPMAVYEKLARAKRERAMYIHFQNPMHDD